MLFVVWMYRQVFHCCRKVSSILFSPDKKDESLPASNLPWLWIGAQWEDGVVVDYTNEVNAAISYGITIDAKWLDELTGVSDVKWLYLDTKTLEEADFPSIGFVIDDPVREESENEGESPDPLTSTSE